MIAASVSMCTARWAARWNSMLKIASVPGTEAQVCHERPPHDMLSGSQIRVLMGLLSGIQSQIFAYLRISMSSELR